MSTLCPFSHMSRMQAENEPHVYVLTSRVFSCPFCSCLPRSECIVIAASAGTLQTIMRVRKSVCFCGIQISTPQACRHVSTCHPNEWQILDSSFSEFYPSRSLKSVRREPLLAGRTKTARGKAKVSTRNIRRGPFTCHLCLHGRVTDEGGWARFRLCCSTHYRLGQGVSSVSICLLPRVHPVHLARVGLNVPSSPRAPES